MIVEWMCISIHEYLGMKYGRHDDDDDGRE